MALANDQRSVFVRERIALNYNRSSLCCSYLVQTLKWLADHFHVTLVKLSYSISPSDYGDNKNDVALAHHFIAFDRINLKRSEGSQLAAALHVLGHTWLKQKL